MQVPIGCCWKPTGRVWAEFGSVLIALGQSLYYTYLGLTGVPFVFGRPPEVSPLTSVKAS